MKRKKLDNGGDGVSHHRYTFDRVCMTNEFVNAGSVKRYDSARGIALHSPISFVSFFDSLSLCLIAPQAKEYFWI